MLYYEDGTEYNPPVNPLLEKWNKLYPPIAMPQYSQVCDGYSCMWCGRCPKGSHWQIPEDDKDIYTKWKIEEAKYEEANKVHGSLMIPFNM